MDDFALTQSYPPAMQDAFSIDTGDFNTPISPETVAARTTRAQYGLNGIVDTSPEEIRSSIATGAEGPLRESVASKLDQMKAQDRQNEIVKLAQQRPLTPDIQNKIYGLAGQHKLTDPNSVFEDTFAVNYVNNIYKVNGFNNEAPKFSWLQDAISLLPAETQKVSDVAAEFISKNLYSRQMEENAEEARKNQPWFGMNDPKNPWAGASLTSGYIPDLVKNFTFLYPQLKLRGLVEGSENQTAANATIAQVLDNQRRQLFELPYDQFKVEYKRIMDHLLETSPILAAQFSHGMSGLSQDETALSNAMELGGVGPALEAATVAKLGYTAGKLIFQSTNLGKSMVRSVAHVGEETPHVAAAAGVGDLREAAVQKASHIILEELQGAPNETKRALEALPTNLRIDVADVQSNPGRFGQEIVNRIREIYTSGENSLSEALLKWDRVNRTPVAVSSEDISRTIAEMQRGELKGMDNSILDTKGPLHEPISNTYVYEHIIGTPDGEYFKDRQTALNVAKANGLVIRPTVSSRIAEINRDIGKLNKEANTVKLADKFVKVEGESPTAGIKFGGEAPKPANQNLTAKVLELRKEREALTKQYPEANKQTSTPLPRTEGFEVREKDAGAGWYLHVTMHLPETHEVIRDSLITSKFDSIGAYRKTLLGNDISTSLPPSRFGGWANALMGWARTPEETLSKQERVARRITVSSTSKVIGLIDENKSALKALPVKFYKDFDRILTAAQHKRDPLTNLPGYFEKSPGDLDGMYMRHLGRLPEFSETAAYFEFKKLIEFDRIFREISNYRNRARAGTQSHRFLLETEDGNKAASPFFDGVKMNHIPGGEDTIMVLGDKLGEETFFKANSPELSSKFPDLHKDVLEGRQKVMRVWNPSDHPFIDFAPSSRGKEVRYVVGKDFETRPLSWQAINRTGGGHLMPDYELYIKQPIVNREFVGRTVTDHYHGDRTGFAVQDRAVGDEMVRDLNRVRELLHANDIEGAKRAHLDSKALPMDWDEHLAAYKESKGPDGKTIEARFNTRYPFRIVPKDQLIVDMDNSLTDMSNFKHPDGRVSNIFKDGTKSGSDARMANVEFTAARDAYDLKAITRERGTDGNPHFSLQPAKYVDPITTMDRGLSRIVNTTIMDDLKYYSSEHWIQQAKNHLNASPSELASSPFYWFNKAEYLPGTPIDVKWTLENARQRAKNFIGVASDLDAWAHRAAQNLSDSIYRGTGSSKLSLVPMKMWPAVKDPITLVRSWSYHLTQGLGNLNTFFTNVATFANIYAISPRHAPSGSLATILHSISYFNKSEEVMNYFDKLATSYNRSPMVKAGLRVDWKPGWWKEAATHMDNAGFGVVRNENAFLSTPSNVNVLRGLTKNAPMAAISDVGSKIFEAGLLPFKAGNTYTRQAAFFTSYLEWRNANPTAAYDRFAKERVIQRADILDHNMSRASNSTLHTGVMSVPMQFEAYSLRLSEMLFGKRLTLMEKARLAAVSSLFFGVRYGPLGAAGIPISNYLYKQAQDKLNYVPGDNPVSTGVMEGGLTVLGAYITGNGDFEKGNLYDFSRFGNKNPSTLDTLMASDKTFWDVLGGAPLSKMKDIVNFGSPLVRAAASMFIKDDPNAPKAWKLTSDDLWDAARIMNSGNKLRQTLLAVNTLKWSSKNEIVITDVSKASAIFMGATGVNPIEQQDTFSKQEWENEQGKLYRQAENLFIKEYRRAIFAGNTKDESAFDTHMKNAYAALNAADYPSERYGILMSRANNGLESKATSVPESYYTKNLPDNRLNDKIQTLGRVQELQRKKGIQ